jgi:hypothetical protein
MAILWPNSERETVLSRIRGKSCSNSSCVHITYNSDVTRHIQATSNGRNWNKISFDKQLYRARYTTTPQCRRLFFCNGMQHIATRGTILRGDVVRHHDVYSYVLVYVLIRTRAYSYGALANH